MIGGADMFKRYELHNHTSQSDASITCAQLLDIMERDRVDAFALTDHNTISGHAIMRRLLAERPHKIQCIYGMEYTTYYGHILCLNLERYVPWDMIDRARPELLFKACRAAGALTGIAHPYSYGYPFARGCRFDMTVNDFSDVDFIEVFNDLEPLHQVNERGLIWWEQLVLSGVRLAATCGMDLHGDWDMAMNFATYAQGAPQGDAAVELADAIRHQRTWISKGMLLRWQAAADGIHFELEDVNKPGFVPADRYIMTLTGVDTTRAYDISSGSILLARGDMPRGDALIPKLYGGAPSIENLICVAPVIYA